MVLFTDLTTLKRYKTPEEILEDFCPKRLELYNIRRDGDIKTLKDELKYTNNKIRFLTEVDPPDENTKKLIVTKRTESDLYKEMDDRGYDRKFEKRKGKGKKKGEEDEDDEEDDGEEKKESEEEGVWTYNYLLSQTFKGSMTNGMKRLLKIKNDLETEIARLESTTADEIWLGELSVFEKKYNDWIPNADDDRDDYADGPKKKKVKK